MLFWLLFSVGILVTLYYEYVRIRSDYTAYANVRDRSVLAVITVVIFFPVIEEIIFRGYLPGTFGTGSDLIMNTVLFSGMHAGNWFITKNTAATIIQVYMTAFLSVFLYNAHEYFGSIIVPIFLHALWNGVNLLLVSLIQRRCVPEDLVTALKVEYLLDANTYFRMRGYRTRDDNGVCSQKSYQVTKKTKLSKYFQTKCLLSALNTRRYDSWDFYIPDSARDSAKDPVRCIPDSSIEGKVVFIKN